MTIAPGAETTHSGHVVSVGSSLVLVDGTSFDLQSPHPGAPPGLAYTSSPPQQGVSGGVVVMGTMSLPSGTQTIFSGHTMSVGSNIFGVDGTSYRKGASGGLVFGTVTLPPGSEITQSGPVIPVGSSSAVVDGTLCTWAAPASSPTSTPASELLTTMMVTHNVLLCFLDIQAGMMLHINLLALFEDLFLIHL